MRRLKHPNVVGYIGTERAEDGTLHIFMEYVPGGSVHSLLRRFGSFSETVIRVYTRQILAGLEYLHRHQIMHRDIKGANILVDNSGVIKLADFGASKRLAEMVTTEGAIGASRERRIGWRRRLSNRRDTGDKRTYGASVARCSRWPRENPLGANTAAKCPRSFTSRRASRRRPSGVDVSRGERFPPPLLQPRAEGQAQRDTTASTSFRARLTVRDAVAVQRRSTLLGDVRRVPPRRRIPGGAPRRARAGDGSPRRPLGRSERRTDRRYPHVRPENTRARRQRRRARR